jgi:hypothetical protein
MDVNLDGFPSETVLQLDGNETQFDSSLDSCLSDNDDEQCEDQFSTLPKIYAANARSLFPKFEDFTEKLVNNRIDVVQISETWQDVKKMDHKDKIDLLENKYGYKSYSFARHKYRDNGDLTGGGGSEIFVSQRNFTSSLIEDIVVPHNVELVWVKVIPKHKSVVKMFIFCGLYSKPNQNYS